MTRYFKYIALLLLIFVTGLVTAQTPTFSGSIAKIMYNNCTSCHNANGNAPFSLATYEQAYSMRMSIRNSVSTNRMPPWPPENGYGHFAKNRSLTDNQVNDIKAWVDAGAPEGDKQSTPPLPFYSSGSQLGRKDFSAKLPNYTLVSNVDEYRCFVIPAGTNVTKYVSGLEIIPGNKKVVHHVLVFYDSLGVCRKLDEKTPEPGYVNFGNVGPNVDKLVGTWVPGSSPILFPQGTGVRVSANGDFVLQVHYAPDYLGEMDESQINITYSDATVNREIFLVPVLNHSTNMVNGPLVIAANTVKSFQEKQFVPYNVTLLGVAPHMHMIGTNIKSYAINVVGDTIKLINIPNWDFHWQGLYNFSKAIKLPAFSTLYAEASYDNTTNNPHNPNRALPKKVTLGESTDDEMMLVYLAFMEYRAGDEKNLKIDTLNKTYLSIRNTSVNSNLFTIYPNPISTINSVTVSMSTNNPSVNKKLVVTDVNGKQIFNTIFTGDSYTFILNEMPGIYFCEISNNYEKLIKKLVVTK
ncbi:MAG: T9SS type A sorting domain-containing protein [Bacteroidota bacterium]|nr:T9SS type A sorting domain-containing protein [Bacteroidota bacterium]